MHILVADGDRHFLELLRGVIEREGHEVVVVSDPKRGLALLAGRAPQLLVAGLGLPDDGGPSLVRALRENPAGQDSRVVLIGTGSQRERRPVQVLVAECAVHRVLRRPFPMFDLVDIVRDIDQELAGGTGDEEPSLNDLENSTVLGPVSVTSGGKLSEVRLPAASAYLNLSLHQANLQRISRLWARRACGVLRLDSGPGRAQGWMTLGHGGPLDSDGWELISASLHGGTLEFEPGRVDATGDHLGLGAMIFGRVRDPDQEGFLSTVAFQALLRVRADAPLPSLPLAVSSRQLLEVATNSQALGELATSMGLKVSEIGPDLHALDSMGLIVLGEPVDRKPVPGQPRHRTAADRQRQRHADELSHSSVAAVAPRGPLDEHSDVVSNPTQIKRGGGMRARRQDPLSEWPRVRRRLAERGRSWASRQAAIQTSGDRTQRVDRLRKELGRLRGHDPAVILGVPADASPALLNEAAERMRARYQSMTVDTSLTRDGQALAAEILTCIEEAHGLMQSGKPTRSEPMLSLPEEDRLLQAAHEQMELNRWAEALTLLKRARDRRLDHPGVLAALGWATLHDDKMSEAKRDEEARGLLLLAVQFGRDHVEANVFLARYLELRGKDEPALRHANRALKVDAGNPDALALVRRLERTIQAP